MEETSTATLDGVYSCLTSKGIIMTSTDSVKTAVEDKFRELFGNDIDLTEETPIGRMVEWMTFLLSQFPRITAQNANQTNVNYATGIYLDGIGSLFRKTRNQAQSTRVGVTLTGVAGTVIPSGSRMTDVNGNAFQLEADVTIGSGGTGEGVAASVEKEDISIVAGGLNHIDTSVVGWYSVTNSSSSALTTGGETESDASFRTRIENGRNSAVGYLASMKTAIEEITGVSDDIVVENDTNVVKEVDGVEMDPHSIFVCVSGGDDTKIAETIFKTKSAGCGYTRISNSSNEKDKSVFDVFGVRHHVYFYSPNELAVDVRVRVNTGRYTGSDITTDVTEAVTGWFAGTNEEVTGPRIGTDVYASDVALAISKDVPTAWIRDVGVKSVGTTTYEQSVYIAASERASLGTVTVELV